MGRNVNGIELTAEESSALAYEWTISDMMEDEEARLKKLLDAGAISRDEYLDGMENLRETAESRYERDCMSVADESRDEVSDWDDLQEYLEAF